ncbi:hypothetical protein [Pseudoroseicyclus tamaricis]|uniref:Uncharacterized protein n=1 Tax=Pseudoroseicyclus tamaricis TaxID=2705421 RepID=A0A6B2K632_9RHOB|nr:hypothetical protein [Pseudoroseicyclus tamaricis]NDV02296.1 hypothetical protein [Pseudoroseicyclus tamaricis]
MDDMLWDAVDTARRGPIDPSLGEHELARIFPKADLALVPIYRDLLALAEEFQMFTGRQLGLWEQIGELYGAITYGITLSREGGRSTGGTLGDQRVAIRTIAPGGDEAVMVSRADPFDRLLIVRIDENFEVRGQMLPRAALPAGESAEIRVGWGDLRPFN